MPSRMEAVKRYKPTGQTGWSAARKNILQTVRSQPGLGVREIAQITQHSGITVSKHLDLLRQQGEVVGVQDGPRLRHYLPGKERVPRPAWDENDAAIVNRLERPVTLVNLARQMPRLPLSTLKYRVARLLKHGHLVKRGTTRPALLTRRRRLPP